jgi:hypothetical protein
MAILVMKPSHEGFRQSYREGEGRLDFAWALSLRGSILPAVTLNANVALHINNEFQPK